MSVKVLKLRRETKPNGSTFETDEEFVEVVVRRMTRHYFLLPEELPPYGPVNVTEENSKTVLVTDADEVLLRLPARVDDVDYIARLIVDRQRARRSHKRKSEERSR